VTRGLPSLVDCNKVHLLKREPLTMATTTLPLKLKYPPEVEAFVAEQLAAGKFEGESELATAAIRVVQELAARERKFREDLKRSLEQADRGEVEPWDLEGILRELDADLDAAQRSQ
jgi:Arc/MetJ-type ribon-helix-helix transcriptional regulator